MEARNERLERKWERIEEKLEAKEELNDSWFPKDEFLPKPKEPTSDCLHDNCIGCKNGTCSGVHGISCPCKKCSVWS